MNRRNFFKTTVAFTSLMPIVGFTTATINKPKVELDYDRRSHLLGGNYFTPHTLFTPEEIEEAGFVFVKHISFIHDFNNPLRPIMKSYCKSNDINLKPLVVKTRMFTPWYIKTYDLDAGRRRGIEDVEDYFNKKDIFKPMIINFMKEMKYHYVYMVLLGDSPCTWEGKFGNSDMIYHLYPVFIRGARLPEVQIL